MLSDFLLLTTEEITPSLYFSPDQEMQLSPLAGNKINWEVVFTFSVIINVLLSELQEIIFESLFGVLLSFLILLSLRLKIYTSLRPIDSCFPPEEINANLFLSPEKIGLESIPGLFINLFKLLPSDSITDMSEFTNPVLIFVSS